MHQRKKRNSSKVNLTISVIFHSLLLLAVFFFAAREGILGKQLKTLAVTMAPKEKKPVEPPKEKPAEAKAAAPKQAEAPKLAAAAPPPIQSATAPASSTAAPIAAPAAVSLPAFAFDDGAKETVSVSDPSTVYKGLVEMAFRSRWNRPEDLDDSKFEADVEIHIDASGKVIGTNWVRGSGDVKWDKSVKDALAGVRAISRPPPKGFPGTFVVRFDVESEMAEGTMHLTSR